MICSTELVVEEHIEEESNETDVLLQEGEDVVEKGFTLLARNLQNLQQCTHSIVDFVCCIIFIHN